MKLCRSSLSTANSLINGMLASEKSDINELISKIETFTVESNELLKGQSWDMFRKSFDKYIGALNNSSSLAENIMIAATEANSKMSAYLNEMGGDDVDDDALEELKISARQAEDTYNDLYYNPEKSAESEISIGEAESILSSIQREIAKYERLKTVDSEAYSIITSVSFESNQEYI